MVEIEVVGRHALLFDDDAAAEFVNSKNALVDWNSLLIDRYDVRHLLPSPPPPRRRRHQQKSLSPSSLSSMELELDYERYLDLPSPSDEQESDESMKPAASGGYATVPFSYGNTEDPNDQKNANSGLECPGFQPPFLVPDSLFQNIPPTEKLHQIIARTALFVSKHGGQSEIVLRVKQGDNPTFGFLMPDHHLHPYFRFLVDNGEHLLSKDEGRPQHEEKVFDADHGTGVGALSLLGSLYGTGEDEDAAAEIGSTSKENVPGETSNNNNQLQQQQQSLNSNHFVSGGETSDVNAKISLGANKTGYPGSATLQEEGLSKPSLSLKEKVSALRRNSFTSVIKAGGTVGTRKGELSLLTPAPEKMRASSLPPLPKTERVLLEPPSELKRLVDKIVEFNLKNGKQFEAVLLEQDREHGRFPFLMPSNQYHPYYLQVLHKAQESKSIAKSFLSEKGASDKKISKESDTVSFDSAGCDIPYDSSDRKEKFKMVLGKSKKDGSDSLSKSTHQQPEVRVDAAQVAAILQAATRGMKYPDLGILPSSSKNGNNYPQGTDGSLQSSRPEIVNVPGVKVVAKTVAIETTSEADSSETHLTREQKLKAERLKRAKMFTAMLKNGSASSLTEPSRALSAERRDSGASGCDSKVNIVAKDREGSSAPIDVSSDKNGKPERKHSEDEYKERKSRRKYRLRCSGYEGDKAEEDEDEDDGGEDEKRVHKHTRKKPWDAAVKGDKGGKTEDEATNKGRRKKHRSHHSSSEDDNEERDYEYSRKKHRSHRSLHEDATEEETDEEMYDKYSRKKHRRSYDDDKEQGDDHERDYRKKHRSHSSSYKDDKHEDEDDRVHRYSRNRHSSRGDDEEGEKDHRHSRKKHWSHQSSHYSRDRHKHRKDHSSRHRHKYDSSDEEHMHHNRGDKHTKESHATKEELEEGEISPKFSDQSKGTLTAGTGAVAGISASREASLDISCTNQEQRGGSQPSDTSGVPDDLRAKIRAMLMSTM